MYHAAVFLHIVAAVVWVGGMVFLSLVLVPVARRLPPAERAALVTQVGVRFRTVGWVAMAVLVGNGLANAAVRGVTWESVMTGRLLASTWGRILAVKVALVAVILGASILHDFVVGPAASRAATGQATPEALRRRRQAAWLGRVNLLLALTVLLLATFLVRVVP
ncbi:MAG: CopD family protein [Firmicutes bacterium]|nr:CopD family protein [Bacillota bacterium]